MRPNRWLVWAGWLVGALGLLVLLSSVRWKLTANPWYAMVPLTTALLLWAGIYLREARLRSLLPFRRRG